MRGMDYTSSHLKDPQHVNHDAQPMNELASMTSTPPPVLDLPPQQLQDQHSSLVRPPPSPSPFHTSIGLLQYHLRFEGNDSSICQRDW